jgi:hypothetical protein
MNTYIIILLISGGVVVLYLLNRLAEVLKLPAVILLLTLGAASRYICEFYDIHIHALETALPVLGLVGLALIVLEGGLDLSLSRQKLPLIGKALLSATLVLLITAAIISPIIYLLNPGKGWYLSTLNSIPLATVSSAIAIPAISKLSERLKEFLIYETTFADILGIMAFQLLAGSRNPGMSDLAVFTGGALGTIILSLATGALLLFVLPKLGHHLKFFLVIAILVFLYTIGKVMHLPGLLLLLIFGLMMNNLELIKKLFPIRQARFLWDIEDSDLMQFKTITVESAFVIRSFFFVLFGFSMIITDLADPILLLTALAFTIVFILGRLSVISWLFGKTDLKTNTLIIPRGLVTAILFVGMADDQRLIPEAMVAAVVLLSVIAMVVGLVSAKPTEINEPENNH